MVLEKSRYKESGNVLWYILIAVVLLGLLNVVFSRGTNSVDQSGDFEKNTIKVSKILRYAKSIEVAIQQLQMRGCSENEISFENPVVAGYTNPTSPSDKSCHVFEPEGGGLTYQAPVSDWITNPTGACFVDVGGGVNVPCIVFYGDYVFDSWMCIPDIGTGGSNGVVCRTNLLKNDTELTLIIPWVKKSLCLELNNRLGVTNPSGDAPSDTNASWGKKFVGTFVEGSNIGDSGDGTIYLPGKFSGCYRHTNTSYGDPSTYHFYHILLAR